MDRNIAITIPMPNIWNNSLIVGIASIAILPGSSASSKDAQVPFFARIDSEIPQLWYANILMLVSLTTYSKFSLPLKICHVFESAFSLTWDDALNLYTVNDSSHRANLRRNASVVFSIGSSLDKENSIDITFPYSAFDLQLSYPIINDTNSSIRYFPLRPPTIDGTLILGRAFLQETYLIVDYDRNNFSIHQALFGGNPRIITAIDPTVTKPSSSPSFTNSILPGASNIIKGEHKLSYGAYTGIGVGSAIALLILGLGAIFWRRHLAKVKAIDNQQRFDKAELHGEAKSPLEVVGSERLELQTIESGQELVGSRHEPWELEGCGVPIIELNTTDEVRRGSL